MGHLYTWYYYPLVERIPISNSLAFYLDNPRTDKEVKAAEQFLLRMRDSEASCFSLVANSKDDIDSIEQVLFRFRDGFIEIDQYVEQRFSTYGREEIINFIARMLIIARYPSSGTGEIGIRDLNHLLEERRKGVIALPGDPPDVTNEDRLYDFGHLLSLLIHTDEDSYWGQSFLLNQDSLVMDDDPWFNFHSFGATSPHFSRGQLNMDPDWEWVFLPSIRRQLAASVQELDGAFNKGETGKLLYIGSILRIVNGEAHDPKVKILLLTSILELMLTHNPDFQRFNVDDSINKQFQLKTAILMYMDNPEADLNHLKRRLKEIYQVRSGIAHGNFGELLKIGKTDSLALLEGYIKDLYDFIRVVLKMYLRDSVFIEFLKNG